MKSAQDELYQSCASYLVCTTAGKRPTTLLTAMKSLLPRFFCTSALLCLLLAAPPPVSANPLKSIGAGLKRLNPFKKTVENPAPIPVAPVVKPKAKAKPSVAKTTSPSPPKKKKPASSTPKKATTAAVSPSTNKTTEHTSHPKAAKPAVASAAASANTEVVPSTETTAAAVNENTPPVPNEVAASVDPPVATPTEIPFGTPVMGKKGHVRSPYAADQGMVDVTDIPAGAKVKCPFTGKIFRVP